MVGESEIVKAQLWWMVWHLSHGTNPTTNGADECESCDLESRMHPSTVHYSLGSSRMPVTTKIINYMFSRKCLLQTFICRCYWVGGRSKLYSRPHVWFDCLFLRCCWNPKQLPWESSIKWPIYVAFLRSAGAWISWLVEPLRIPGQRYPGG